MPTPPRRQTLRRLALLIAAVGFVVAGVLHFVKPDAFRRIVPPALPSPATLVAVSGLAEIAGGIGLLVRPLRRAAGWGLIVLLIAVFPANVQMAVRAEAFDDVAPAWVLWARLPLQGVLIACVAWVSGLRRRPHCLTPS